MSSKNFWVQLNDERWNHDLVPGKWVTQSSHGSKQEAMLAARVLLDAGRLDVRILAARHLISNKEERGK